MPSGELNLDTLIKEMSPVLNDGSYVYATIENPSDELKEKAICQIKEKEGTTLIMSQQYANALQVNYDTVFAWITLKIHSSLNAVGLTAKVAQALAKKNISCNVVAGYFHDHLFVDKSDGLKAINTLKKLSKDNMLRPLDVRVKKLTTTLASITDQRKSELKNLAKAISDQKNTLGFSKVNFICTHNSRRSQLAQIWFWKALKFYNIKGVASFSGGTEATAFNIRTVDALRRFGFDITSLDETVNPKYIVRDGMGGEREMVMFSKKIKDIANPSSDFIAVMVCDHADQNCPIVFGANTRISLPYSDPKQSDGQSNEKYTYDEKVREIGREMLFLIKLISE